MKKFISCLSIGLSLSLMYAHYSLAQNIQQVPTTQSVRLRGTVLEVRETSIVFKERNGEVIPITLDQQLSIQEVYPIEMAKIEKNSYIGTAALTDKNGRLIALEVHVFPESMRGTGEGHRPWDSVPGSTMTNAVVEELISVGNSREMHLRYKDGEKIVFVPESVPVVSYRPGNSGLLVPGANAVVIAAEKNGQPTTSRIMVGRDGFKPPM